MEDGWRDEWGMSGGLVVARRKVSNEGYRITVVCKVVCYGSTTRTNSKYSKYSV